MDREPWGWENGKNTAMLCLLRRFPSRMREPIYDVSNLYSVNSPGNSDDTRAAELWIHGRANRIDHLIPARPPANGACRCCCGARSTHAATKELARGTGAKGFDIPSIDCIILYLIMVTTVSIFDWPPVAFFDLAKMSPFNPGPTLSMLHACSPNDATALRKRC